VYFEEFSIDIILPAAL